MIKIEALDNLFLQESHISAIKWNGLKSSLAFNRGLGVDNDSCGGGLTLLWRDEIEFQILQYSNITFMHLCQVAQKKYWLFTGIYEHSNSKKKNGNLKAHKIIETLRWNPMASG